MEILCACSVDQGVDEGFAVEGDEVVDLFADAGVDDGEFELGGDGEDDAAFGGAVELGEDDAGDAGGFGEEAAPGEARSPGGGLPARPGRVGGAAARRFPWAGALGSRPPEG